MPQILVTDIIPCTLCGALITYDTRPWHLKWHARLNARMLQPRDPAPMKAGSSTGSCTDTAVGLMGGPLLNCHLAAGHTGRHTDGQASWTPVCGRECPEFGTSDELRCVMSIGHGGHHSNGRAWWTYADGS